MQESRISLYPTAEIDIETMKASQPDGNVVEAILEYKDQNIKLGGYNYNVFIGSTAGRKGFPNQDFAGLSQKEISVEGKVYQCLLSTVADGVSSRELSEETSQSIIENTIRNFSKTNKEYPSFKALGKDLWNWVSEGAQVSKALRGVSTVSLFLLAAHEEETKGIAINCGDSRVFWATPKYVESARVHTEVLNPRNAITFSLGADRVNKKIYHDTYLIDNPVEIFLCTDTFAYRFDGVHFPEEMIPCFGRALTYLNDHLTAISVKRI